MVHPHKLFRCYSLAAPVLQKVTEIFCSNAITVILCPKGWSRETWACGLQNPGAPPEFCSSFTLSQDLLPGLNPQCLPLLPFWTHRFLLQFPPSFPMGLWEQRSSCLTITPHRIISCDHNSDGNHLPHGSAPLSWPSLPPPSLADCGKSGRKRVTLFKSCILTKPKLWWTESKHTHFIKKYTDSSSPLCHFTHSRAIAAALNMDSSIQGKTRLPSKPLLFTPVSCAECIDSISYFLNHKTRCAPSRPIYGDWINAI